MTDKVSIPKLHSIKLKNTDNVQSFNFKNSDMDENPLIAISDAIDADLENIVITGWTKDGKFFRRSSYAWRAFTIYDLQAHIHAFFMEG